MIRMHARAPAPKAAQTNEGGGGDEEEGKMRSKEGFACLLVFLIVCFFKLIFLFVSFCFGF